jgi:hypothetical protein
MFHVKPRAGLLAGSASVQPRLEEEERAVERGGQPLQPFLLLGVCFLVASCGTFWRGERETSESVKASKARPTPGDDAAHPLESDRFAFGEAIERRRSQHRSEHGEWSLRLESFSHPACAGVEAAQRRRCPLLSVRWGTSKDCPGGVELELREPRQEIGELRREMLCHLAFARSATGSRCPLHLEGVQVRSMRRGERWVFQIVVEGAEAVRELRSRLRALLP